MSDCAVGIGTGSSFSHHYRPRTVQIAQNAHKQTGKALLTSPIGKEIIFYYLQSQITKPEVKM